MSCSSQREKQANKLIVMMDRVYQIVDHKLIFHFGEKDFEIDLRQLIWPCSAFSIFYLLFWRKSGFHDMNKVRKLRAQHVERENPDDVPYEPKEVVHIFIFVIFIFMLYLCYICF